MSGEREEASGDRIELPVRAAYDRWSGFYDEYENPMVYAAGRVLQRGLLQAVAGRRVFEFGCGTGRNLAELKAAGASEAAGCDLSEGMLAAARRREAGLRLFQHDMRERLPEEPGLYDDALFCLSLEHVEDLQRPLGEARRMVREGGRITIIEIHPFLALSGVGAHFVEGGEEVRMAVFPHQFADYLQAFAGLGLKVRGCREWRPRDLGEAAPLKCMKRGPDFPIVVEFELERGGQSSCQQE